jgi:hypothetical protein
MGYNFNGLKKAATPKGNAVFNFAGLKKAAPEKQEPSTAQIFGIGDKDRAVPADARFVETEPKHDGVMQRTNAAVSDATDTQEKPEAGLMGELKQASSILRSIGKRTMEPLNRAAGGIGKIMQGTGATPVRAMAGTVPQRPKYDKDKTIEGVRDIATGAADAGITTLLPGTMIAANAAADAFELPNASPAESAAQGIAEGMKHAKEAAQMAIDGEGVMTPLPGGGSVNTSALLRLMRGGVEGYMGAITPRSKFLNVLTKLGPLTEQSETAKMAMAPVSESGVLKPTLEDKRFQTPEERDLEVVGDLILPMGIEHGIGGYKARRMKQRMEEAKRQIEDAKLRGNDEPGADVVRPEGTDNPVVPGSISGAQEMPKYERPPFNFEGLKPAEKPEMMSKAEVASGRVAPISVDDLVSRIDNPDMKRVDLDTPKNAGGAKKKYADVDAGEYPLLAFMNGGGIKIKAEAAYDKKKRRMVQRGEYVDTPKVFIAGKNEDGLTLARAAEAYNEMLPEGVEHLTDSEFLEKVNDEALRYDRKGKQGKVVDTPIAKEDRITFSRMGFDEQAKFKELAEPVAEHIAYKYGWDENQVAEAVAGVMNGKGNELRKGPQRLLQEINDALTNEGIGVEYEGQDQFIPLNDLVDSHKRRQNEPQISAEERARIDEENNYVPFAIAGAAAGAGALAQRLLNDEDIDEKALSAAAGSMAMFAGLGRAGGEGKPKREVLKDAAKQWLEKGARSEYFKGWFGDWEKAPEWSSKVVDDKGAPLVVYSGHNNTPLYKNFDPKKATSGGFYASENPEIAGGYALGKLGVREGYEHGNQYRIAGKNGDLNKKINQIQLTEEQKRKIDDMTVEPNRNGVDDYQWNLNNMDHYIDGHANYDRDVRRWKMTGGKYNLQNIYEFYEQMGYTLSYPKQGNDPYFMRQVKNEFEDLMDELGIKWQSHDWAQPGVMPIYLNIRKPLDANKPFPQDLLQALKQAAKYERNKDMNYVGATKWTTDYPMKEWVADIERGDEFWSTQIPKKALPIIKRFGYDGIKEFGNKSGSPENRQVNWIAFEPEQIKSAAGNKGTFDPSAKDMLMGAAGAGLLAAGAAAGDDDKNKMLAGLGIVAGAAGGKVKVEKYYDAFKKNNAPRIQTLDGAGRERMVWADDAYSTYMDKSDDTKRRIRWGVQLSDGRIVSMESAFKITQPEIYERMKAKGITTTGKEGRFNLFKRMPEAEQNAIIDSIPFDDIAAEYKGKQWPGADEVSRWMDKNEHFLAGLGFRTEISNKLANRVYDAYDSFKNADKEWIEKGTDSKYFKKWFGNSKLVDTDGKPIKLYHGTGFTDIKEFLPNGGIEGEWQRSLDHFKKAQSKNEQYGTMNFRSGSFFSPDPSYAENYAADGQGVLYPVYIKAENPIYFDMVTKKVTGTDPNKTPDALIMTEGDKINEVAVIDPTQIKSATGNRGTFSANAKNILFGTAAAGVGIAGAQLMMNQDDKSAAGPAMAGVVLSGAVGRMSPKLRDKFNAMQRHVQGRFALGEIRSANLGTALRETVNEYLSKGEGRFLSKEERALLMQASGSWNAKQQAKEAGRNFKLQNQVMQFARSIEPKYEDLTDAQGEAASTKRSVVEAGWITRGMWENMKDRVTDEINRNKDYAHLGPEGRRELFKTVEKNYEYLIERSNEAIWNGQLGLGPDGGRALGGDNPYTQYDDLSRLGVNMRDADRNFEAFFGKDYGKAKMAFLDPLDKSKEAHSDLQKKVLDDLQANVIKKYKIKRGTREDAAVQNYGEGARFMEVTVPPEVLTVFSDDVKGGPDGKYMPGVEFKEKRKAMEEAKLAEWVKQKFGPGAMPKERTGKNKLTVEVPYEKADLVKEFGEKRANELVQAEAWFRKAYDDILGKVNVVRAKIYPGNPNKLIRRRRDYFRHYREVADQLGGLLNIFESPGLGLIDSKLSGLSAETEPKAKWASFMQKRFGSMTDESAIGGFLNYLPSASYAINIDPHISRLRGLRETIAEGTERTKSANNFVEWLHDYANNLSGKTADVDRFAMKLIGRGNLRALNSFNNRVKANTVLGNVGSAVAQLANVPAGIASAKQHSAAGLKDTFVDLFKKNANSGKSGFLKTRYEDNLYMPFDVRWIDQPKKMAKWMLQAGDQLGSRFIWNSHYRKAIAEGMQEKEAVRFADNKTRRLVGGRGIGEVPIMQSSKMMQLVAPFQLEVGNLIWAVKDFAKAKDYSALALLALSAYMFNKAKENTVGGDGILLDPVQAMIDAAELIGEEDDTALGIAKGAGRLTGELLSNIPFGQTAADLYPEYGAEDVLGTGINIPTRKQFFGREDPNRFGSGLLGMKALTDPLYKVLPPWGGGQAKKTKQAIEAIREGGVYDKSGRYKFDTEDEELRSLIFGPNNTTGAKEYFEGKE